MTAATKSSGFTLIEAVIVITLASLLLAMIGRFLTAPIQAYLSGVQRSELVDMADLAERRMVDEIRNALPNSVRTPGSSCLELMPINALGRYRFDHWASDSSQGDTLDFNGSDLSFDVMGFFTPPQAAKPPATQNWVVVNPQGATGVNDVYHGDNIGIYSSYDNGNIGLSSSNIANPSDRHRFYVTPNRSIIYHCSGGTLYKDNRVPTYPAPACPSAASGSAVALADHINQCIFNYSGLGLANGLVTFYVQWLDDNGEALSLTREIDVYNDP